MQARADSEFAAAEAGADLPDGEEDGIENKPAGPAWEGSDRDYKYEELLGQTQILCKPKLSGSCCLNAAGLTSDLSAS